MKQSALPLIVVIVDELADLMMVDQKACGGIHDPCDQLNHRLSYLRFDQGQCAFVSLLLLSGTVTHGHLG